ncbi:MAG TPA: hypothetical protein VMH87_01585 [Pseudomonadales bacterium]|nr:hypothetical protein [Pseudomonadales bacterium]
MTICLIARAGERAIQDWVLDEQTVFSIPVAIDRVTTISFPGPIEAIDAAQASVQPQKAAPFLISYNKGASFFSVRAEQPKVVTNVNIRWNDKTYVLELIESNAPLLSVTFQSPPDRSESGTVDAVTPTRLLALLDEAKAYPLLAAYHPEAVAQVAYRNYEKQPRIVDCPDYAIKIVEAFRFDPEDTLIFRVGITNKTSKQLQYSPNGFSLRVGERTYPQSISDASGFVPPHAEVPAYFAVTGTPNGERNDISLKNDFFVILEAHPVDASLPPASPVQGPPHESP